MAASKTTRPASNGARRPVPKPRKPPLPPVTVAKLEETGKLLERVVAENASLFVDRGQAYKNTHREGSMRPLAALEAAQVAVALGGENPLHDAEEAQESTLRAYDEPDGREILLAAGIGAAPAFIAAVRSVVALVEMPAADFEEACEHGTLDDAVETRAQELRHLELDQARQRASAAFAHYAKAAGFEPGEAWRLPVQAVWQALGDAMSHLVDGSASSQLIDSAASTPGPDDQSSTS